MSTHNQSTLGGIEALAVIIDSLAAATLGNIADVLEQSRPGDDINQYHIDATAVVREHIKHGWKDTYSTLVGQEPLPVYSLREQCLIHIVNSNLMLPDLALEEAEQVDADRYRAEAFIYTVLAAGQDDPIGFAETNPTLNNSGLNAISQVLVLIQPVYLREISQMLVKHHADNDGLDDNSRGTVLHQMLFNAINMSITPIIESTGEPTSVRDQFVREFAELYGTQPGNLVDHLVHFLLQTTGYYK